MRRPELANYRALFDTGAIGVAVTDGNRHFLDCNLAFVEMLGYDDPSELVGKSAADLTFPHETPAMRAQIERLRRGEIGEGGIEKQYRRKDGTPVWVRLALSPIEGTEMFFCFFEDISGRKHAELELRETAGELLAAQELGRVGSWVWYPHEERNRRSEEARRIMRLSADEWESEDPDLFLRRLDPEEQAAASDKFNAAFESASRYEDEYRIVQDGEERWLRVQGDVELDEHGEPWRMVGVLIDVSDSRLAERELRETAAYLSLAQKVGRVGTWTWYPDDDSSELSAETIRLYGIAEDAGARPAAEHFFGLIHPDDKARVLAAAREAFETAGEIAAEYRHILPGGEERWLRAQGGAETGPDGTPFRLLGVVMDITESKRAEREQRTLVEQLRQSQKLDALGQLAGGVAHDFNNVLMVIAGTTQLALMRAPDTPLRDELAEILRTAERASQLTRQLLVFSRRQPVVAQLVDLNEIVAEARLMLGRLIETTIEIRALLSPEPLPVFADRAQLEQVIVNLALNSRDAMPDGGRLTLRTDSVDGPAGRRALVSVEDTGTGIPVENLERIFEPFFTTKEPGKGTGLGLSTVYGAVDAAGGEISVSSELGSGSVFTVRLPLRSRRARPNARRRRWSSRLE